MRTKVFRIAGLLLSLILCMQFVACALPAKPAGTKGSVYPHTYAEELMDAADLMKGIVAAAAPGKETDERFVSALLDLSVKLFKATAGESDGENALISPLSILTALAMAANGAKGKALEEMETVLCGMPVEELNEYLATYLRALPSTEKSKFAFANSVWFKDCGDFTVNEAFLHKLADVYGAQAYKHDFAPVVVDLINIWCNTHTGGMIKEIIKEVDPATVMILLNALSFDAEWYEIYTEEAVRPGVFTDHAGKRQKVTMMASEEDLYLSGDNVSGFLKPYAGGAYSFAALLPGEGVDVYDYIASLTGEKLKAILDGAETATVYATMPKFTSGCEFMLNDVLKALGMPTAFGPGADLSGMGESAEGGLCISKVLHKTYLSVDERGTKAGAVTAVVVDAYGMPSEIFYEVTLDRPFIYMIVDNATNTPIFIGVQSSVDT